MRRFYVLAWEVLAIGARTSREKGRDLHDSAVRWAEGPESEEAELLLARADLVEHGSHRFPGKVA